MRERGLLGGLFIMVATLALSSVLWCKMASCSLEAHRDIINWCRNRIEDRLTASLLSSIAEEIGREALLYEAFSYVFLVAGSVALTYIAVRLRESEYVFTTFVIVYVMACIAFLFPHATTLMLISTAALIFAIVFYSITQRRETATPRRPLSYP